MTNGTVEVFQHELAHCNGWYHAPFEIGVDPPDNLVHPYDGELVVILTGSDFSGQNETIDFAQRGTRFIMKWDYTVPELCKQFWKERGIVAVSKDIDRIVGCSIR